MEAQVPGSGTRTRMFLFRLRWSWRPYLSVNIADGWRGFTAVGPEEVSGGSVLLGKWLRFFCRSLRIALLRFAACVSTYTLWRGIPRGEASKGHLFLHGCYLL